MRDLERNGRLVYHSKRYLTLDGVEYFGAPVALRCNPMPVVTDYSTVPKGTVVTATKRFTLSKCVDLVEIVAGDRFYLDVVPTEDYYMGGDADYLVIAVEDTTCISVILQRMEV